MTVSETLAQVPVLMKDVEQAHANLKLATKVLTEQDREIGVLKAIQRSLTVQVSAVKAGVDSVYADQRRSMDAATASISQVAITAEKVDSKLAERIDHVGTTLDRVIRRVTDLEKTNGHRDGLETGMLARIEKLEQRLAREDAKAAVKVQVQAAVQALNDINTCGPAPWEPLPTPIKPLDWGVLVEYIGHRTAISSNTGWRGHVIPRPADAPQFGVTGREFVWVLNTSGDKPSYHGSLPENLKRL